MKQSTKFNDDTATPKDPSLRKIIDEATAASLTTSSTLASKP